ncbi:MAG: adenosine deaminase [Pseudomonadota bacterium]
MNWEAIPKVELHLHLEGAAPPDFVRTLAAEAGRSLDGVFDESGQYAWHDFTSFLDCYMAVCSVLTTPEAYCRLTEAVLAASAAEGVVYTEILVCPDLCGGGDPVAWAEHLAALDAAIDAQPVEVRLIGTAIRNLGPERALRAAELSADAGGRLTGFGLAGEERFGHPADYAPAFDIARAAGLGLTAHAGELDGAGSVRATLEHLRVSRLGHGVRAIEDPDLVAEIVRRGTVLEVCPGSNVALGVFGDLAAHPVDALLADGAAVTISTDDPPFFRTGLSTEYQALAAAFGWDMPRFQQVNQTAADAAFCDEPTRAKVIARLREASAEGR